MMEGIILCKLCILDDKEIPAQVLLGGMYLCKTCAVHWHTDEWPTDEPVDEDAYSDDNDNYDDWDGVI
jgi:hypothetical protein